MDQLRSRARPKIDADAGGISKAREGEGPSGEGKGPKAIRLLLTYILPSTARLRESLRSQDDLVIAGGQLHRGRTGQSYVSE